MKRLFFAMLVAFWAPMAIAATVVHSVKSPNAPETPYRHLLIYADGNHFNNRVYLEEKTMKALSAHSPVALTASTAVLIPTETYSPKDLDALYQKLGIDAILHISQTKNEEEVQWVEKASSDSATTTTTTTKKDSTGKKKKEKSRSTTQTSDTDWVPETHYHRIYTFTLEDIKTKESYWYASTDSRSAFTGSLKRGAVDRATKEFLKSGLIETDTPAKIDSPKRDKYR